MRIDRLTVRNFRGFEEREFSFHAQMNLLVGVNGSGKTSVLDALAVALGQWRVGPYTRDQHRDIEDRDVRLISVPTWEQQYPCTVSVDGSVLGQEVSWKTTEPFSVDTNKLSALLGVAVEAHDKVMQGDKSLLLPLVAYFGTARIQPTSLENPPIGMADLVDKTSMSRLAGYDDHLNSRISSRSLTLWMARESWRQNGSGPSAQYRAVQGAVLGCIEGALSFDFDKSRVEPVLDIEGQGLQPFPNLSDGQRTMVALVADLARRAATLNPHLGDRVLLDTPGVVLIDELDLHLHPIWQKRVIEDLRRTFPKVQFFATTHSPFLVQSLRSDEELVMLDGNSSMAELGNKSLGMVAALMGVPMSDKSIRYDEMVVAAERYLKLLDEAEKGSETAKAQLREEPMPYADNAAYQAFLNLKKAVKLGE